MLSASLAKTSLRKGSSWNERRAGLQNGSACDASFLARACKVSPKVLSIEKVSLSKAASRVWSRVVKLVIRGYSDKAG